MRLFREPLLHFLLAGAALFGIYGWLNRGDDPNAGPLPQVHISEGDVSSLRETWALQWQREPTAEELRGAVRQLLNEQLLALEARNMRLDENDTVVRRRLAQKLNFIIEGTTRLVEPTEQALLAYYTSHPDQFRTEARVSFTQVYFSSINRKAPTVDARQSLRVRPSILSQISMGYKTRYGDFRRNSALSRCTHEFYDCNPLI